MLKWTKLAEGFIRQCRVRELVLLALCLYSAGMMLGTALPKPLKKPIIFGMVGTFVASYLPLALKVIKVARKEGLLDE